PDCRDLPALAGAEEARRARARGRAERRAPAARARRQPPAFHHRLDRRADAIAALGGGAALLERARAARPPLATARFQREIRRRPQPPGARRAARLVERRD